MSSPAGSPRPASKMTRPAAAAAADAVVIDPAKTGVKPVPDSAVSQRPAAAPKHYRGSGGKPANVSANYIALNIKEGMGVFEYEVSEGFVIIICLT